MMQTKNVRILSFKGDLKLDIDNDKIFMHIALLKLTFEYISSVRGKCIIGYKIGIGLAGTEVACCFFNIPHVQTQLNRFGNIHVILLFLMLPRDRFVPDIDTSQQQVSSAVWHALKVASFFTSVFLYFSGLSGSLGPALLIVEN
jgi:hypothetical protein